MNNPFSQDLAEARRSGNPAHVQTALRSFLPHGAGARETRADRIIQNALSDPETLEMVEITRRHFQRIPMTEPQLAKAKQMFTHTIQRGLTEADALGSGQVPTPVANIILELFAVYGVARATLGIVPMFSGNTKLPRITAVTSASWVQPSQQPTTLTPDTTLAGTNLTDVANTLIVLVEVSEEWRNDVNIAGTAAFLKSCSSGLMAALDLTAFAGTGASDATNGGQTGIFPNGTVVNVSAGAGNVSAATLQRDDFLAAVGKLAPAAIQRGVRAWANPSLVPALMLLKSGNIFLVKTPLENDSDDWSICGFPLSLTVAAPSTNNPGSQVMAFGNGPAYQIGLRQDVNIELGDGGPYFAKNTRIYRVSIRARCDITDTTWFTVLKNAAA